MTNQYYLDKIKQGGKALKTKMPILGSGDTLFMVEGVSQEDLSYSAQLWMRSSSGFSYSYFANRVKGGYVGEALEYDAYAPCIRAKTEQFDELYFQEAMNDSLMMGGRIILVSRIIAYKERVFQVKSMLSTELICE